MNTSKQYTKQIGKVFKKNYDKEIYEFEGEFPSIFIDCCRILSEDVASEIYNRFVTYSDREFKEALYHLVNLFELFEENYDVENDPLTDEEWEYLKMVVNDSTDELGMELVQYIMQVMLDVNQI